MAMMTSSRRSGVAEIPFSHFALVNQIGFGTYGKVYKAKWTTSASNSNMGFNPGAAIAVKDMNDKKALNTEAEQLSHVCHPNIIQLYGKSTTNGFFLLMELMENGSLHELLHGSENIPYRAGHAVSWGVQCASAVVYLHQRGLVHRDLKSLNLLLKNRWRELKICDFGTVASLKTYMTNNRGSAAWMAPEVFAGTRYTEKCDVFSFGIIIWEMFARKKPYADFGKDIQSLAILWKVHQGLRPPRVANIPDVLDQLMTDCWDKDPLKRPSMRQAFDVMEKLQRLVPGGDRPLRDAVDQLRTPEINTPSAPVFNRQGPLLPSPSSFGVKELPPSFQKGHRRGRSDESAMFNAAGRNTLLRESVPPISEVKRSVSSILPNDGDIDLQQPGTSSQFLTPPPTRFDKLSVSSPSEDGDVVIGRCDADDCISLEPYLRPITPDPDSPESVAIYEQHKSAARLYHAKQLRVGQLQQQREQLMDWIRRAIEVEELVKTKNQLVRTRDELLAKVPQSNNKEQNTRHQ